MSGSGSQRGLGMGKGSKGIRKRGSGRGATGRSAAAAAAAAAANIPPIAVGRGRLGGPAAGRSATHAAETQQQQQQQRVQPAPIFLQPGRRRPIEEKDAATVMQLMAEDEQPAISSASEASTLTTTATTTTITTATTTPVRSSSRPAGPGEGEEASSPVQLGNVSLSSFFTPGTVRVLSAVVGDFEEEMLMGTLGEEGLYSETVGTDNQPINVSEEEFGGPSSEPDLFQEGEDVDDDVDDDSVKDRDWVPPAPPQNVSSSEEEEDESVGLARRRIIADIGSSRRGMQVPQPAGVSGLQQQQQQHLPLPVPPPAAPKPPPLPPQGDQRQPQQHLCAEGDSSTPLFGISSPCHMWIANMPFAISARGN